MMSPVEVNRSLNVTAATPRNNGVNLSVYTPRSKASRVPSIDIRDTSDKVTNHMVSNTDTYERLSSVTSTSNTNTSRKRKAHKSKPQDRLLIANTMMPLMSFRLIEPKRNKVSNSNGGASIDQQK